MEYGLSYREEHNPAPVKETTSKDSLNDALNEIKAEIEKLKEGDYACFDDDEMQIYTIGLNATIDIIDKYNAKHNAKPKNIEEPDIDEFLADARACGGPDDDLER